MLSLHTKCIVANRYKSIYLGIHETLWLPLMHADAEFNVQTFREETVFSIYAFI